MQNSKPFSAFLSELHSLSRLAIPIIIARISIFFLSIADYIILGLYSDHAKATLEQSYVSAALILIIPFLVVCMGFGSGTQVFISKAWGVKNYTETYRVSERSIPYVFFIAFLAMLATWAFLPILLIYVNVPAESIPHDVYKSRALLVTALLAISIIPQILFDNLASALEGIERPKIGMRVILIANFLNVLINLPLVFGVNLWGIQIIPELGAVGAAITTLIVRTGMALVLFYFWYKVPEFQSVPTRKFIPRKLDLDFKSWQDLRRFGYFLAMLFAVELFAFSFLKILIVIEGYVPLVAFDIVMQFQAIFFMAAIGVGTAISIQVSIDVAQKNLTQVIRSTYAGSLLAILLTLPFLALFLIFPEAMLSPLTRDPAVIVLAVPMIFVCAAWFLQDILQMCFNRALRPLDDIKFPSYFGMVCTFLCCVTIPYGIYLLTGRLTPLAAISWIGVNYTIFFIVLAWRFHIIIGRARHTLALTLPPTSQSST